MEGCASSGSRAPPRPHAHAACICMGCAYCSSVEVDGGPMNPSTDGEREPFVVPAFLAHTTASAAMALAHLDPYRRSRRDAARALARTARRCAAHPSSSPRRSSRAPSTASAGEGSATRVLEWARTCSHHQVHTRCGADGPVEGAYTSPRPVETAPWAATDHHTIGSDSTECIRGSATLVSSLYVNVHSSHRNNKSPNLILLYISKL